MRLLDDVSRTEADDAIAGDSRGLGHRSQPRRVTKANGASRDQPSAALWVTTKTDMLRHLTQLDTPAERVPEITEFWSAGRKPARRQIARSAVRRSAPNAATEHRRPGGNRRAPNGASGADRDLSEGAPNDRYCPADRDTGRSEAAVGPAKPIWLRRAEPQGAVWRVAIR